MTVCSSDDYDLDLQKIPVGVTAEVARTTGESVIVLRNDQSREESTLKLIQKSVEPIAPSLEMRTAWDPTSNQVRWLTDDRFGVYMRYEKENMASLNKSNVPYKVQEGAQSSSTITAISEALFLSGRSNNARFYAYYPYSASNGSSLQIPYTLPTNQTSPTALANADIMIAPSITANGNDPFVNLAFEHKMVMLSFKISAGVSLVTTLKSVSVTGTSVTNRGTLNLETNTAIPNVNATFSPFVTVNKSLSLLAPPIYVDILINPCSFTANSTQTKFKVTLELAALLNSTRTTSLETTATFVGGYRYNYNLLVVLSI